MEPHFVVCLGFRPVLIANEYREWRPSYLHYDYVMRDDLGQPLTVEHFELPRKSKYSYWERLARRYEGYAGYGSPVPTSGRPYRVKSYRRPKTLQALRASEGVVQEDLEPEFRACRTRWYLPSDRSDARRHRERCWKSQRRTQWKD